MEDILHGWTDRPLIMGPNWSRFCPSQVWTSATVRRCCYDVLCQDSFFQSWSWKLGVTVAAWCANTNQLFPDTAARISRKWAAFCMSVPSKSVKNPFLGHNWFAASWQVEMQRRRKDAARWTPEFGYHYRLVHIPSLVLFCSIYIRFCWLHSWSSRKAMSNEERMALTQHQDGPFELRTLISHACGFVGSSKRWQDVTFI